MRSASDHAALLSLSKTRESHRRNLRNPTDDAVINHSAAAHPAKSCPCGTRTAANVVGLEMKKVVQKLNRTPKTFALEPPCTSPSVPQAPDRWCIRQKKSTSGMALKERFNSGPR
ncbi:hypothetical protein SAMN02927900_02485 [Rhizobium mongolense subsp. loessense]|uniref:Uncharacterized protein n=1 Tax=Rhizobium mongolense subsp. loessense TaxID=158890 RepID=A0A1G4RDS5_9HYPH|nr:hypothetical protein SAMN02927900_02485 [Rhizobium mongolense subsp. loessense]